MMNKDIQSYNDSLSSDEKEICDLLAQEINTILPKAENKIWHAHPVWFIDKNPIVGYSKLKGGIQLLFWSGQSFEESDLQKTGSFKAAEKRYTSNSQIDRNNLQTWLKKAIEIQWNYRDIVKKKGILERL